VGSITLPATVTAIAIVAGGLCTAVAQEDQSPRARSAETSARPLLLEKEEGEVRTRRIHTDSSSPASAQFVLKVSPKNNGSRHLVAGTELLAPGATLPLAMSARCEQANDRLEERAIRISHGEVSEGVRSTRSPQAAARAPARRVARRATPATRGALGPSGRPSGRPCVVARA
jgi:hypothetical protein